MPTAFLKSTASFNVSGSLKQILVRGAPRFGRCF
jgi:hypothetical protein